MAEEEKLVEEEKKEEPEKAPSDVKTKATELIKQQTEAAERMEAANKKHEELIEADAKVKLEETFDGKADAGKGKQEETDADYAKKVMANDVETK